MNYCVIFFSAESPLQVPSESAAKSGHSKHEFSREFDEKKKGRRPISNDSNDKNICLQELVHR